MPAAWRGSNRSGIKAGFLAMVLGGVLAGTGSLALLPIYFREEARSKEELTRNLTLPLLVLGGIWATAGLAGGLGLGIGVGLGPAGLIKAGLGGLIGAALAPPSTSSSGRCSPTTSIPWLRWPRPGISD